MDKLGSAMHTNQLHCDTTGKRRRAMLVLRIYSLVVIATAAPSGDLRCYQLNARQQNRCVPDSDVMSAARRTPPFIAKSAASVVPCRAASRAEHDYRKYDLLDTPNCRVATLTRPVLYF